MPAKHLYFTSGATESINLIFHLAVRENGVKRIITSKIEHHAVLESAHVFAEKFGIELSFVSLEANGDVSLAHLTELLVSSEKKTLVSLMHVNNEIANILPLDEVVKICKAHNALFHSDTVQSIGHFNLDLSEVLIDFFNASAHKFHGPVGVGFVYIGEGIRLNAMLTGGEQEKDFIG